MKRSIFLILMIIGGFLASSGALAGKGGIPWCESQLSECLIDLENAQALPATGQTTCWDIFSIEISCAGTGHDGEIQAGAVLSYTDTGLTIVDNNTNLEWMKQDDNNLFAPDACPFGNLDKDCVFTWDETFAFVATLNTEPCFADYCDWRVPNVKELQSIVNYENYPAVSPEFHSGCVEGCTVGDCSCTAVELTARYWSSTSYANVPTHAWYVSFDIGMVYFDDKINERRVRAVRGGL